MAKEGERRDPRSPKGTYGTRVYYIVRSRTWYPSTNRIIKSFCSLAYMMMNRVAR